MFAIHSANIPEVAAVLIMVNVSRVIVILVVSCVLVFGVKTVYGEYEALYRLEFELCDASVSRFGLTSADIEVDLRFNNPTVHDTPPFRAEFNVYLDNGYIGHGNIQETRVLASSSMLRSMTFTLQYINVTKAIVDALRNRSSNLTARGTIHTGILFGTVPLSFPFHTQVQLMRDIKYGHITVEQAKELIESVHSLLILDVRTPSDFRSGHIEGAINIPLEELQQRLGEIDPNDELLVYLRTGIRSSRAMQILADNGFSRVYNMLGGIEA